MAGHGQQRNDLEELYFTAPGQSNIFSIGPSTCPHPAEEDSGMLDDNDLTTGFLPHTSEQLDSLTASQLAASVVRSHSSIRLVLRKIGNWIAAATLSIMCVVIPVVTYNALSERKLDIAAFDSAGVMVLGTLILSIRLVYLHFTHWYMPNVQKYVIRILWMVPLYAVQSWLSLRFREARIYIDTIRDLYEAYVISSFLYYLIELLGGQDALIRTLRTIAQNDPELAEHLGNHGPLLNLVLEPWELGAEFMLQCKHGVLQYVVVKTIATFLTFIFEFMGVYGEGHFEWNVAYPYLAFILNCSVMYALYCLVKLFHGVHEELRNPIDWHPLGKFLCVKGVVFFTWWQGVIIFYLKAHGIIDNIGAWSGEQVANGLIDYCICIEMVFFSIAHAYTFTYQEYLPATVQEAISEYERAISSEDDNGENANSGSFRTPRRTRATPYRPPETLPRPMKFKDAFWSSTLPSETVQDIRRLRSGIDRAVSQASSPGSISLRGIGTSESSEETSKAGPIVTARSIV
jgi:Organic solute transporter Ostalpha